MSKHKTKLVCVGWGIVYYLNPVTDHPFLVQRTAGVETEELAIKALSPGDPTYWGQAKELHGAIAKKLWVEVKDE